MERLSVPLEVKTADCWRPRVPGGQQVLWSGVFSVDGGGSNTELLLFDISPDLNREMNKDPDFYSSVNKPNNPSEPKSLEPKAVLFKKKYMDSVLVVKQGSWTVFFIGTSSGQLIMLPMDKNNNPACPKEIYRASGNDNIFSKLLLDPVDHKHIYLQFKKQNLTYETPEGKSVWRNCDVDLKVANETLYCPVRIRYDPDPQFPTFITRRTGNNVQVMIQCLDWNLEMTTEELSVWGYKDGKQYPCIMKGKNQTHTGASFFICQIENTTHIKFSQLTIKYGQMTVQVGNPPLLDQYLLILRLLLVPCGTAVLVIICQCLAVKNKP
ncbi:uncharacterized protein LOC129376185 [Poeciliopsis prolifica]|uniref:uncharacterized protein LOC129376185 n=1 Tax=Poeciliopsis prolifica TaxID=188132 RepID=UPI00241423CF|nr:uncharacterized protein LOC129376185 [Poeciliopsis prolifica]